MQKQDDREFWDVDGKIEVSFDEIYQKYRPMVYKIAKMYLLKGNLVGLTYEDLCQEGFCGLLHAIQRFQSQKNASFATYAFVCIRTSIANSLRSLCRNKPYEFLVPYSLDYEVSEDDCYGDFVMGNEDLFEKVAYHQLMTIFIEFKNNLKFEDALTFELQYNGFSYAEISSLLDLPIVRVKSKVYRIRRQLREYLQKKKIVSKDFIS